MAEGGHPIAALLGGESVAGKSGDVDVSSFTGNGKVVGFYFSAHWCPPCRAFTPQLAEWYKKLKKGTNGENFEIVFISSDKDQTKFDEYYADMPWHSLPYAKRDVKSKLSQKFKVTGIPTLVFLDGETGSLITSEGRSVVMEDPDGKDFPWRPKSFNEIITGKFVNNKGEETTWDELQGKCLGVYFSAHWCGPCRAFTPNLIKTYNKLKEDGKDFEIIFVSSDNDEDSFKEYFDTMPWLSIPFNNERKKPLSRLFDVSGIPTLVIIDENGKMITANGRGAVTMDPEGKEFPWHPKPVNKLGGSTAGDINDSAALIWFTTATDSEEEVKKIMLPIAKEHIETYKETENELIFYYATEDDEDDIVESLKTFCSFDESVKLAIINIPGQCVYKSDEDNITEDVIKQFVKKYIAKELTERSLRM